MHSRHSLGFRFLYLAGDNYKKPDVLLIFFEELVLRKKNFPHFSLICNWSTSSVKKSVGLKES
jgi:hypothetical protein